jgi:nucleoside-triphosphatase
VSRIGGNSEVLAHIDFPGPLRVGRYGVDLDAFERVALPALEELGHVVVIDELGKMELASPRFVAAVDGVLASDRFVLATVHVHRHPITDRYKRSPGIETMHVTVTNRDGLVDEIADRMVSQIRGGDG